MIVNERDPLQEAIEEAFAIPEATFERILSDPEYRAANAELYRLAFLDMNRKLGGLTPLYSEERAELMLKANRIADFWTQASEH